MTDIGASRTRVEIPGEHIEVKSTFDHVLEYGKTVVRGVGYMLGAALVWKAMAAWFITVVLVYLVYLDPQFQERQFYGMPAREFFVLFGYPGLMVLVITNTLSARFAPDHVRRLDYAVSFLGALAVGVMAYLVFAMKMGPADMSANDIMFLTCVVAFGVFDVIVNQHFMRDIQSRQDAVHAIANYRPGEVTNPDHPIALLLTATGSKEIGPFGDVRFRWGPARSVIMSIPDEQIAPYSGRTV